jgi:N-acyl-D-amino-acid deacylase
MPRVFDLILHSAILIDGSGEPARTQGLDVGIRGDRIEAIGDLSAAEARRRIDLNGLALSPGFIDLHTHSDVSILQSPRMESSVSQGVTLEVAGNCGLFVGLTLPEKGFELERRLSHNSGGLDWKTPAEFMSRVEENGCAANMMFLAGHGTLRKRVMGMENREPTPAEIAAMQDLLRETMRQGAAGISSGLEYTPSRYATTEELIEVSKAAAEFGGFYATHMRDEAAGLINSVEESIRIGREAGIAVQISHHKAEGKPNWGRVKESLALMDAARAEGLDVLCDQYPYTAFMTGLSIRVLPSWAQEGTPEEVAERLRRPEIEEKVVDALKAANPDWDLLQIAIAHKDRAMQGRTVASLAAERGMDPALFAVRLLAEEKGMVACIAFQMSEEDVKTVMRHPCTAIGSDAAATSPEGERGRDKIHPRAYGSFPRVLGLYSREEGVFPLEEAVRRMTSLPARRLRLKDRGVLREGSYADLVAFNPATVRDTATYAEPHSYPQGIDYVFVNGEPVIEKGRHTQRLPGRVLRWTAAS